MVSDGDRKVDAEIPSPHAGILVAICGLSGQTVAVNTVVGAIKP
jgi:pyruvate/2-oxoglutarate dehydrogenase complex dihydrolipoamide acyltransferase (E2) component